MKAFICLALLVAVSFATNNTTPNFIIGTWYTTYTDVSSDCCTPTGTVTFTAASSGTVMTSTEWSGSLCSGLGITPSSVVSVPFGSEASYDELPHLEDVKDASDFEKGLGGEGLYYFVDGLFDSYTFTNGTQEVLVTFDVVPKAATGACSTLISKV